MKVPCRHCKVPTESRILSGIGTCPKCSAAWVKKYTDLHKHS